MRRNLTVAVLGGAVVLCLCGPSMGLGATLDVGDTAVDFTLTEYGSDRQVHLYDYEGEIVLLDFFGYYCGHCGTAASELEPQINQYYAQQGGNPDGIPVRLVAVSISDADPVALQDFVSGYALDLVLDDSNRDVFGDYGKGFIPHLAIVNGAAGTNRDQWEILYSNYGYARGDYRTLRAMVDSIVVVPEPASVILAMVAGGLVTLGICLGRRRP